MKQIKINAKGMDVNHALEELNKKATEIMEKYPEAMCTIEFENSETLVATFEIEND